MTKLREGLSLLFELLLVVLIAVGIQIRFSGVNWHQGANLHPDEYGLTNTLTRLQLPHTLASYFNTRLSPLSPYDQYDIHGAKTADGPDNRMRWGQWPITLIRLAAEASGQTGYDEIRMLGRRLSALCDMLTVLLILLTGWRLHGRRTGLLAAALSALAVMQIQQSHFMTVDNFGGFFTALALYACVRIAQRPCVGRPVLVSTGPINTTGQYRFDPYCWRWCLLFGVAFGMAVACKINLLPLGGMLLVALFLSIADLKLKARSDLARILGIAALHGVLAMGVALLTFRFTQPMSFRAAEGDTTWLTLQPNPDWVDSMALAQNESNGIGGGPPGEQWAGRLAIIFPLVNQAVWGMGLPLGMTAWAALFWAGWRSLRHGEWRPHLIGLVWVVGYFGYMGTRWVKSVRYFLPTYPFLCLFAAWGLMRLWRMATTPLFPPIYASKPGPQRATSSVNGGMKGGPAWITPALLTLTVLGGTLGWAESFVTAIYHTDHTRIQATRWIFENIPGPFHLAIETADGLTRYQPIPAADGLAVTGIYDYRTRFTAQYTGRLKTITIPHALAENAATRLQISIFTDGDGNPLIAESQVDIEPSPGLTSGPAEMGFENAAIQAGQSYWLAASVPGGGQVTLYRSVVANESWDEGLPVPFDGLDPFGGLYRGLEMEVRWYDDENKRQMFLDRLALVDYIILPSQRGIWSTCRIPRTYPMTMAYYRALFDGSLGFEQAASFSSPFRFGPLVISDVGGTLAWGQEPIIPLFNNNLLAAEEAFSVYDHPPVWIFKKRADFSLENAAQILNSVDLSQVVIQSPREADGPICR